ncbi:MAG: hypothetical protein IVW55_00200 [Chloroflexi bacterium]|nr:hypothetical protein [Chloroflexota bacterium]
MVGADDYPPKPFSPRWLVAKPNLLLPSPVYVVRPWADCRTRRFRGDKYAIHPQDEQKSFPYISNSGLQDDIQVADKRRHRDYRDGTGQAIPIIFSPFLNFSIALF